MVHEDFEEQDYNLLNATAISQQETLGVIHSRSNSSSCSRDGCTLGSNPAEEAWVELMTAIPKIRSAEMDIKAMVSDSPMPAQHVMDELITALKRSGREYYSIEAIRLLWEKEISNDITSVADDLDAMLKELSQHWIGEDFDAFEEHINQIIKALYVTFDSVELLIAELQEQEDTIFHLQGGDSGEVPFPAPQYFDAERSKDDADIHVRPPFWEGDCQVMTKEEALELTGGDESAPTDFHQREEDRVEEIIEERLESMTPEEREAQNLGELENEAQAQARDEIQPDIDAYKQEVHNGQLGESERLTQEVFSNRDQVESTLSAAKFEADPVEIEHQDFTEQANGPSYGGLTSPGPIDSPNSSGMLAPGGHTPGTSPTVAEVEEARYGTPNDTGIWDTSDGVDDDEPSDGLFSGTGGGGGGMGTATAPSAATASPGGAGGGIGGAGFAPGGRPGTAPSGSAGAGRGPGGGAGAGRGPGGAGAGAGRGGGAGMRGGGGMPMGMMGGAPGGAGQGQGQNNTKGGQGRTMSSMGRPSGAASKAVAGGTPGVVGAGAPGAAAGKGKDEKAEKKPLKYKSPLAAALEKRQAEKEEQKKQPQPAESTEPDELDFHDEFDIEEDYWGAHSARKDEYR